MAACPGAGETCGTSSPADLRGVALHEPVISQDPFCTREQGGEGGRGRGRGAPRGPQLAVLIAVLFSCLCWCAQASAAPANRCAHRGGQCRQRTISGLDSDGSGAVTGLQRALFNSNIFSMEPCRRTAALSLAASVLIAQLVAISCTGGHSRCLKVSRAALRRTASSHCPEMAAELAAPAATCCQAGLARTIDTFSAESLHK